MGDIGTALMNAFGGGGGGTPAPSGGAGGGNTIGDLFSSIGNLFGGGGAAATPAASANAGGSESSSSSSSEQSCPWCSICSCTNLAVPLAQKANEARSRIFSHSDFIAVQPDDMSHYSLNCPNRGPR